MLPHAAPSIVYGELQPHVLVAEFHVYGNVQEQTLPDVQAKFAVDKQLIIVPVVEHAAPFNPSFILERIYYYFWI